MAYDSWDDDWEDNPVVRQPVSQPKIQLPADLIEILRIRQTSKIEFEGTVVIKDFRNLDYQSEKYIHCPNFFTGKNDEYQWAMNFWPSSFIYRNSPYIGISFGLVNRDKKDALVPDLRFIASIVGNDGKKYSTSSTFFINNRDYCATFDKFALRSDLLKNNKLLQNGILKIAFKVTVESSDEETSYHEICQSKMNANVYEAEKYTDFQLVVGGERFKVHRAILAARSPVFEAMFDNNMRESAEGKVEIKDVEAKVMRKLLRFMYIGKVDDFENLAKKILVAAEKYQINDLIEVCEDALVDKLNMNNVYDTIRFADQNNAQYLLKKAMEFFRRNVKEISAKADFKSHINALSGDLKTEIICILTK